MPPLHALLSLFSLLLLLLALSSSVDCSFNSTCSSVFSCPGGLAMDEANLRIVLTPGYWPSPFIAYPIRSSAGSDLSWIPAQDSASSVSLFDVGYTPDICVGCSDRYLTSIDNPNATNANSYVSAQLDSKVSYFPFSTVYSGVFYLYWNNRSASLMSQNDLDEVFDASNCNTPYYRVLVASLPYNLKEHGSYTLYIDQLGGSAGFALRLVEDAPGNDIDKPLWDVLALILSLVAAYTIGRAAQIVYHNRRVKSEQAGLLDGYRSIDASIQEPNNAAVAASSATAKPKKERVRSLDTFRGFALFIMIFVNQGAGGYAFLDHSKWNGLNLADLVFPWFIFMMGASMAISFNSLERSNASKFSVFRKITIRSIKLMLLCWICNTGNSQSISDVRIPGVLMRFSISYFVVANILLFTPKWTPLAESDGTRDLLLDLKRHIYEFPIVLGILVLWLSITFGLDVPGCGKGYLGPGGPYLDGGKYIGCTGGANYYLDKLIFGINHIYQTPTEDEIYSTGPADPEGALGCLTSILMVFMGVMAGRIVVYFRSHRVRLIRWLIFAVVFGLIALALCGWDITYKSQGVMPINKNMWSLSFILFQASLAQFCLPALYLVQDFYPFYTGIPFESMGKNSIVVYMASELTSNMFPFAFNPPDMANGCPAIVSHEWQLWNNLYTATVYALMAIWMDSEKFYLNL